MNKNKKTNLDEKPSAQSHELQDNHFIAECIKHGLDPATTSISELIKAKN